MSIFKDADTQLLPGFERQVVEVGGKPVLTLTKGTGPALMMLHGDPQTHLCWHHLAPHFTNKFSVVLTDIRGRGETHKPGHIKGSNAYSKREMAAEQLAVMKALGHERFALVAHDRGARVARRLTLDHPEAVTRLVVMDIIPALDFYGGMNAQIAHEYFYFSFLTQEYPIPDRMIKENSEPFMRLILEGLSDQSAHYDELAMKAYLSASTAADAITAMCECFRAGYHIDQLHDKADRAAGNRISCPTLVMWGERGVVGKHYDMHRIWGDWCDQPQFAPMPSGHFIPEEAPDAVLGELTRFLADPSRHHRSV